MYSTPPGSATSSASIATSRPTRTRSRTSNSTPNPDSEGLGEAAVVDRAEDEVAVDALDHLAGALGPLARRGRGDPAHHLGVAALVHAVLAPGTGVVLGARDLDARH